MLSRSAALLSSLALGLLCSLPACDDAASGDGSEADGGETGGGETGGGSVCGDEWIEGEKDPATPSIMEEYGAPCTTDADCEPILGADGICVTEILGVYELPGGFCSKACDLANTSVSFEHDAAQCSAEGGVTCVGAQGLFTACIIECTDDSQCKREGYGCRNMPTLAAEGDPKFCLMSTKDCCTTDSGECSE